LAGMDLTLIDFQGISGGEDHETWVRRVLLQKNIQPVENVSRAELVEVVRRAIPTTGDPDYQAYMAIFDANVPTPHASNLIFYPTDYDEETNTWGGGQPIGVYDPTPEQIVEWALQGKKK